MFFNTQTYPVQVRSLLKGAPCILMCLTTTFLFWWATYIFVKHEHDHVPKFSYK